MTKWFEIVQQAWIVLWEAFLFQISIFKDSFKNAYLIFKVPKKWKNSIRPIWRSEWIASHKSWNRKFLNLKASLSVENICLGGYSKLLVYFLFFEFQKARRLSQLRMNSWGIAYKPKIDKKFWKCPLRYLRNHTNLSVTNLYFFDCWYVEVR